MLKLCQFVFVVCNVREAEKPVARNRRLRRYFRLIGSAFAAFQFGRAGVRSRAEMLPGIHPANGRKAGRIPFPEQTGALNSPDVKLE